MVSCSNGNDEDMGNVSKEESVCVNFSLSSVPDFFTRDVLWDEDGSYLENYIDIDNNDFWVAFFTKEGDFITEFEGSEITDKTEDNFSATHSLRIEFTGERLKALPKNFINEELKVMIIANWKAFTGSGSYESFANMGINKENPGNVWVNKEFYNFNYSGNSGESWCPSLSDNSKRLIPMMGYAGFKGFTQSSITGTLTANVSVKMVRALAKVTLSVKENLWKSGFTIKSCTLNKYIPQGNVIPDVTLEGNDFGENGDIQIESPSHASNLEFQPGPLSFVNTAEDGENPILTAYIPEINTSGFTTLDDDRPYISVMLALNQEDFKEEKKLELNDNSPSTTTLFHIIRNHHYNYVIDDITGDGNISLKYTVCPWGEGEVDIDFH